MERNKSRFFSYPVSLVACKCNVNEKILSLWTEIVLYVFVLHPILYNAG